MSADIEAVIGLGNPGRKYDETFHNAGFMVVRGLADPGMKWRNWKGAAVVLWEKPILFMPQTFMNLSGEAVRMLADYKNLAPEKMLVVCDDFALKLGKIRVRRNGSAGGHKGLQSIIDLLGSESFPRVRIGIGPVESSGDAAGYVLKNLSGETRVRFSRVIDSAVEAVRFAVENGIEKTMNKYNSAELLK